MTEYFLDRLADFCVQTSFGQLPPQVVHQAKRCVLDLIGCFLGGLALDSDHCVVNYVQHIGGRAEAHLWSMRTRVPAAHAALANGTVADRLELNDGSSAGASIHPGVSVIPAAIAAAEIANASGSDLILAITLGYEVSIRAGLAVASGVREHCVHGPGMIGPLGAAAAASKLRHLNIARTAAALAITGSALPVAPFESFVEGASTKDLYAGWSGFVGTIATEFAARGMDGPHRFLEGKRSVGRLLLHDNPPDVGRALEGLRTHYMIEDVAFKAFAACRSVHPAVTAVLDLRAKNSIVPQDIQLVQVEAYPFAADLSNDTTLNTAVSARLSIPYAIATAIFKGRLDPEDFKSTALSEPQTLALAKRVQVTKAEQYGLGPFGQRASVVTVHLKNGGTLTTEAQHARWDIQEPATDAELEAKFVRLAEMMLPSRQVRSLVDAIWRLDSADSIRKIVGLMSPHQGLRTQRLPVQRSPQESSRAKQQITR